MCFAKIILTWFDTPILNAKATGLVPSRFLSAKVSLSSLAQGAYYHHHYFLSWWLSERRHRHRHRHLRM
jgi:hypothetical protein